MTRNEARAEFAASGLTYDVLSRSNLETLRQMIDTDMMQAGLIDGSLRMRKICRLRTIKSGIEAQIRCKAHYFDSREAVTFSPNGFIGFAGWADDENVQPVLSGFIEWVAHLKKSAQPIGEQIGDQESTNV
jgi:hypothetical protein